MDRVGQRARRAGGECESTLGSVRRRSGWAVGSSYGRRTLLGLALVALLVSGACGYPEPPPALSIGDVGYSELELGALTDAQRAVLADLTALGMIVARGELERLVRPLIARDADRMILQRLAMEITAREAGYDEEALRRAYDAAPEYELEVRHLVVLSERWRSDEERRVAREKAEAALRRIRAGEDFAKVAGEVSEEPGAAERGGLLRPGREGTWVPEFWKAASALAVGAISDVVETEYGFHVLRLEGRRPVPFDEVRGQVLGRLVDLRAAASAAESWADREASALVVDAEAVKAWRPRRAPDGVVLASWPGGTYTGARFREYLVTLDAEAADRVAAADDDAYLRVVRGAARNALLVARAEELGIRLNPAESAAVEKRWMDRVSGWATIFGFRRGAQPQAIKQAAIAALSSGQQNARIARDELRSISQALRAVYPVVDAATDPSRP